VNFAKSILAALADKLPREQIGCASMLYPVMVTPRFVTSAHVVFLLYRAGSRAPVLVLKVARTLDGAPYLRREAANLQMIQSARAGGFDSIPRFVGSCVLASNEVLVQTGLSGVPMTRRSVLRNVAGCVSAIMNFVTDMHAATHRPAGSATIDCAESALSTVERLFPQELALLERTRSIVAALRDVGVGTVFEHGDLSAPNLLVTRDGTLQVVDWELASAEGVPAVDLYFGLAYVAFAHSRAHSDADRVAAVRSAFFGKKAWAAPFVARYSSRLGYGVGAMRPLFVLCWLRYVSSLADRLSTGTRSNEQVATTLRANYYFHIWKTSVLEYHELLPSAEALHSGAKGMVS
jgi:aminoglycoside phosphotransferase (APT) family kinase protein